MNAAVTVSGRRAAGGGITFSAERVFLPWLLSSRSGDWWLETNAEHLVSARPGSSLVVHIFSKVLTALLMDCIPRETSCFCYRIAAGRDVLACGFTAERCVAVGGRRRRKQRPAAVRRQFSPTTRRGPDHSTIAGQ